MQPRPASGVRGDSPWWAIQALPLQWQQLVYEALGKMTPSGRECLSLREGNFISDGSKHKISTVNIFENVKEKKTKVKRKTKKAETEFFHLSAKIHKGWELPGSQNVENKYGIIKKERMQGKIHLVQSPSSSKGCLIKVNVFTILP